MHSDYYHLPEIFEKEKSYILQNCWLLIAHTSELKNNFDFVTLDYLGEKIFIQNFNGTIKAFQNICVHRFNTIHPETHGNRPPVCHYHNWSYNVQGRPSGIPNKAAFDENEIQNLCLKEYEVGLCGCFVFVKLNSDYKVTLRDYLGFFYDSLEALSLHFGEKITDFPMPHKCNWKLAVENVTECYHCACVHKSTFAKIGYGFIPIADLKTYNGSSFGRSPKTEPEKKNVVYEKVINACTLQDKGYFHYYVFPGTFITSSEGFNFYMGNLIPESSTTCTLRVRNFMGGISDENGKLQNMLRFMAEQSNEFLKIVLDEDKVVLESVQRNVALIDRSEILGEEEVRIRGFHDFISNRIYNREVMNEVV